MGLHICYELALPPDTSRDKVLELLGNLRSRSEPIGFHRLTEIREFEGDECNPGRVKDLWNDPWACFCVAAMGRAIHAIKPDLDVPVRPDYTAGFLVFPGRRCEAAAFGFSRRPPVATVRDETLAARHPGWHWHFCCKTQYASVVSEAHFLRCHLGLIELLDAAAGMGIEVTVRDEAGYHQHRDPQRLLETVHAANQLIARIGGRLVDAMDAPGIQVGSPIFEHPQFEHLEGEG